MNNANSLRDIQALKEITDYKVANLYLKKGWCLLSTHVVNNGDPRAVSQHTVYVLGWHDEFGGEPEYPTEEERRAAVFGHELRPVEPSEREQRIREEMGF